MLVTVDWFAEALANFARIAITGASGSGKTTLCQRVNGRDVVHGDDYMHLGWSESSQKMADVVNAIHGPLVVEGVQVPRALRKGMRVDCVIWLERMGRYEHDVDRHRKAQGAGAWTILSEWRQANPRIPFFIQGGIPLKLALPVQEYPEPNDFDDEKRRVRR